MPSQRDISACVKVSLTKDLEARDKFKAVKHKQQQKKCVSDGDLWSEITYGSNQRHEMSDV